MNYNEKLQQIKKELYGMQNEGSLDGYQNQLGNGTFNKEKYDEVMSLFEEIFNNVKTDNPDLSQILGHYTNFAIDTALLLLSKNHDDFDEVIKELENIF